MQLNGTMMPFDFSGCDTVVPWGNDMRPVFVCYVARHGARYLSSEKKVQALRDELLKADSEGYISPRGVEFMRLLESVDSVTAGDWGALNPTGIAEEQELGRQLALTAPELLAKGKVNAVSSYVPRVVMTMYEVCHQLARHSSHLEITASEGRQFSPMLRFSPLIRPIWIILITAPGSRHMMHLLIPAYPRRPDSHFCKNYGRGKDEKADARHVWCTSVASGSRSGVAA